METVPAGVNESCRRLEPSAFITQISVAPVTSELNTIREPSCDGSPRFSRAAGFDSLRAFEPSRSKDQISHDVPVYLSASRRRPSGNQDVGSYVVPQLPMGVKPVPSGPIVKASDPEVNRIREPSRAHVVEA